jgi:hypothetical protein
MRRTLGRPGLVLLIVIITTAPALLFFDPAPLWPRERHVPREPMSYYCLFSDDVAYVGSSRTLARAVSNLFVPHNTHIVPVWRLLTWALVAAAGNLERLPDLLAVASYSILIAVMLMAGRLVARETGRTALGLAAMILVGTTSLMLAPATWYSAGQPLWAGYAILATLWYAQAYRRRGQKTALAFSMVSAMVAGWLWTVGHMAGPVAAVYLWVDGRRQCKLAAAAPLAATAMAVGLSLALGASRIDAKISFHGRTVREAASPAGGLLHTLQAIPENVAFGNLGLAVHTTATQGALLTLGLLALWLSRLWYPGRGPRQKVETDRQSGLPQARPRPVSPLECAGLALLVGSYLVEWTFRGYMDFQFLRTINLRFVVPWYDVIPHIGAVLFVTGWWAETWPATTSAGSATKPRRLTGLASVGLVSLMITMLLLHRPRVDDLIRASVPRLLVTEQQRWPIPRLQMMRANILLQMRAEWQRAALRRLDRAQETASRMGLGRDTIRAIFGHPRLPGNSSQLRPELYGLYDTIALLDLPERGQPVDPLTVFTAIGDSFIEQQEPRPEWLVPKERWPPDDGIAVP